MGKCRCLQTVQRQLRALQRTLGSFSAADSENGSSLDLAKIRRSRKWKMEDIEARFSTANSLTLDPRTPPYTASKGSTPLFNTTCEGNSLICWFENSRWGIGNIICLWRIRSNLAPFKNIWESVRERIGKKKLFLLFGSIYFSGDCKVCMLTKSKSKCWICELASWWIPAVLAPPGPVPVLQHPLSTTVAQWG